MERSLEIKEEMQKRAKELTEMKEKIEKENREFTPEEIDKANKLADEIDGFEISLESALAEERTNDRLQSLKEPQRKPVKPEVKRGRDEERKFRSFGDFLQAVYVAGSGSGQIDNRLTRAATGMGEGIPSDGGSREAPHGSNFMMNSSLIQGSLNYAMA